MLKRLTLLTLALVGCGLSVTQADATLTYDLSGSSGKNTVKQFAVSRFFVKIDDPAQAERYLLFQAGKFFPLYSVDTSRSTYRRLTPDVTPRLGPARRSAPQSALKKKSEKPAGRDATEQAVGQQPPPKAQVGVANSTEGEVETASAGPEDAAGNNDAEPATASSAEPTAQPRPDIAGSDAATSEPASGKTSPVAAPGSGGRSSAPNLRPSKTTRTVAGIRCRVVHEMRDGEPVMEHCMANSAGLGLTKREIITLSRLFGMARDRTFGWLGVGTQDEQFVSVYSRELRNDRLLQLTSVSTQLLPTGHLRIPKTFKRVTSHAQGESASAPKALE
jgi:hypothetical protein